MKKAHPFGYRTLRFGTPAIPLFRILHTHIERIMLLVAQVPQKQAARELVVEESNRP